jgi:hypothetical protein
VIIIVIPAEAFARGRPPEAVWWRQAALPATVPPRPAGRRRPVEPPVVPPGRAAAPFVASHDLSAASEEGTGRERLQSRPSRRSGERWEIKEEMCCGWRGKVDGRGATAEKGCWSCELLWSACNPRVAHLTWKTAAERRCGRVSWFWLEESAGNSRNAPVLCLFAGIRLHQSHSVPTVALSINAPR